MKIPKSDVKSPALKSVTTRRKKSDRKYEGDVTRIKTAVNFSFYLPKMKKKQKSTGLQLGSRNSVRKKPEKRNAKYSTFPFSHIFSKVDKENLLSRLMDVKIFPLFPTIHPDMVQFELSITQC